MTTRSLVPLLSILLIVFICSAFHSIKKGSCTSDDMTIAAVKQLKKYTMIQDFPFYMKKKRKDATAENKKQVITLNSGVRYKFYAIKNEEYEGMPVISIYNNEKQEFLIGSTYNPKLTKFYNELEFECKSTGNYCVSFSFHEGLEGCALAVFSSLVKE